MATTKRKLAEQVMRIISGGSVKNDFQIDIREIMISIEQERDRLVKIELFNSMREGDPGIIGNFISTFSNVEVKEDKDKKLFYSDLPACPISLPYDKGVYQISYMQDQSSTFVRIPNGAIGLYNNMPSKKLLGREGYWVESNYDAINNNQSVTRVYYNDNIKDCLSKVLIKLVAASKDIPP